MAQERKGPTLNTRLAKAETLLLMALVVDCLINPWLYDQPQIPPIGKTLIKMLLIVGCFGALFEIISRAIDGTLNATRNVTTSTFSMPKMGTHVLLMCGIFLAFYWSMHHSTPWRDIQFRERSAISRR
jgi:hypothetical protein